jgi:hypothetical protein
MTIISANFIVASTKVGIVFSAGKKRSNSMLGDRRSSWHSFFRTPKSSDLRPVSRTGLARSYISRNLIVLTGAIRAIILGARIEN